MAAFTTMALIGLAAYSGAKATKSIVDKKKAANAAKLLTAPKPTTPTVPTLATEPPIAPPAPPDPLRAQSDALRGGQRAGKRQQQRALAPGGTLLGGARTTGTAGAATKPKTLLGY